MRFWKRTPAKPTLQDLDDNALAERAKADREAFGVLYERYADKIYRYIYYRTSSTHDAEDLTARVFFRAMAHIDRYVDRGLPFQAWLYRIAHNLVANWHRDHARRKVIPLDEYITLNTPSANPEWAAEDAEERAQLMAAIQRLPEERQQLVLLKFVEKLSNAEIGAIMGRTEGAVKSLYHRTLLALRDDLAAPAEATPAARPTKPSPQQKAI